MSYNKDQLKEELGKANEAERKAFIQSVAEDCSDIEDIITKIIMHDWTTQLELSSEEHELLFHILIMDSYLPNVRDEEGPGLFIDDCTQEYMETDFSKYSTFEDARLDAVVQILTCGSNGWRTLEKVLDIENLEGNQLNEVQFLASVLVKLARGVREEFTMGRFFNIVVNIDASEYTDPKTFNDALKSNAVKQMDKKYVENGDQSDSTETKTITDKVAIENKVAVVSRALSNIRDFKTKMLEGKDLKALNDNVNVPKITMETRALAASRALSNIRKIKKTMLLVKVLNALTDKS